MAITINGTANTVAGLAVGGLPDGTTDADALASNAVTNVKVADDAIGVAELSATGTASSSTYLRGDNSWATVTGTTINNNADNRVITGSGTANTLEGETKFTFDGDTLEVARATEGTYLKVGGDTGGSNASALEFKSSTYGSNGALHTFDATAALGSHAFASNGTSHIRFFAEHGIGIETTAKKEGAYLLNIACDPSSSPVKKGIHYDGDGAGSGQGYTAALFTHSDSAYGNITWSTSGTVYATSSDYRMKENVVNLTGAIDRVKNFKPYRFNFKEDKDTTVDGFFAHEAATVVPEAVKGTKDATETRTNFVKRKDGKLLREGVTEADWIAGKAATPAEFPADSTWGASEEVPVWQSIDQAKLVPLLTAALQEAITKIETLETKVAALEAA